MTKLRALQRAASVTLVGLGFIVARPRPAVAQLNHGQPWDQDDCWADIAGRVPGFGGYWQEGSTLVLALVDTTQRAAALQEVNRLQPGDRHTPIRVEPVRYDFAQLYAWKRLASRYLGESSGAFQATLTDADEMHNRLLVWVADSSELPPARRCLTRKCSRQTRTGRSSAERQRSSRRYGA